MIRLWTAWQRSGIARTILAESEALQTADPHELRAKSYRLREQCLRGPLAPIQVISALALVREAARRAHGTPHYASQLIAGWAMWERSAVEMETGEGKTLAALLAAYLDALSGNGCHVLTANDYLAERDARHAAPVFEQLGLSVGWIVANSSEAERRRAYRCDVAFATVAQIGFDYLRDRLRLAGGAAAGHDRCVQRPYAAAVVDEADSVLLDEARTPLQIATMVPVDDSEAAWRRWADDIAGKLAQDDHFQFDTRSRWLELTEVGCRTVLLSELPRGLVTPPAERLFQFAERALQARHAYRRDHDYLVQDDKILIVSATTGRVLHGRQWQHGLQQAIEAWERLDLSAHSQPMAALTVQALVSRYPRLSGMSGTLRGAQRELREIYGLKITRIRPRKPCLRRRWPCRCFSDMDGKLNAIVSEVRRLSSLGRPILVGTPSIETSERLSELLAAASLAHDLLTARQPHREAEIVADAGRPGRVTITTNMAGRGTDIRLTDAARAAGGLHVIIAGLQPSERCDRQLAGRSARQGDPGSYQEFLSFDDELVRDLPPRDLARLGFPRCRGFSRELPGSWRRWFRRIQSRVERAASDQRREVDRQRRRIEDWAHRMALDPALELCNDSLPEG